LPSMEIVVAASPSGAKGNNAAPVARTLTDVADTASVYLWILRVAPRGIRAVHQFVAQEVAAAAGLEPAVIGAC
jgi:hypothetical protein